MTEQVDDRNCCQNCCHTREGRRSPTSLEPLTCASRGAPEGIRTPNLLIRSQMLYPLSYGRLIQLFVADESAAAEARGFEPPVPFKGDNSLAVSPIRPLWHASRTT